MPPENDPAEQNPVVEEAVSLAAGDSGTGTPPPANTDQGTLELPFKLDDIGEDFTLTGEQARTFLTTRQAQMQAALTRRTQELATERAAVASKAELVDALHSDDPAVWKPAYNELLARRELALPDDDEEVEEEEETEDELDPRVAQALEYVEQQKTEQAAARAADATAKAEQEFAAHVDTEMNRVALEAFGKKTHAEIPEDAKSEIIMQAVHAPRLANGMLDLDAGLAKHLELEEARRARYLASKDVPPVAGGASSGVPNRSAPKSLKDRMVRADAVAGRHYS